MQPDSRRRGPLFDPPERPHGQQAAAAVARVLGSGRAELLPAVAIPLEDSSPEQAGPLLMKLLDDPDPDVVEEAVKSLGAIGYEDARMRIADLLDPWNPELTGAIGEALRDFGDVAGMEAAIDALVPALEHEDPAIRQSAVKEIGQIGGPRARTYLEVALEDEDYEVTREARKRIAKL